MEGLSGFSKSLALPIIDKSGKSLLNTPDWIRVFNATKQSFEIPGFLPKDPEFEGDVTKFVTDANKDLAKGVDVKTAIRKA